MTEWMWRLLKTLVPENMKKVLIIPLYKGKGDMRNHRNYREISFFECFLVRRMRPETEKLIVKKKMHLY